MYILLYGTVLSRLFDDCFDIFSLGFGIILLWLINDFLIAPLSLVKNPISNEVELFYVVIFSEIVDKQQIITM